jgi:Flp pilus assembly pilin Flp
MRRQQSGQAMVEYMLVVSFLVMSMAVGFLYLSNSTSDSFENARETVQVAYP